MTIIPIYFVTIGLNEFIFIFQSVFTPEGNQPEDTPATRTMMMLPLPHKRRTEGNIPSKKANRKSKRGHQTYEVQNII